jgi:hypothetical protein
METAMNADAPINRMENLNEIPSGNATAHDNRRVRPDGEG